MTLAIAHRGAPHQYRENTLPALRTAVITGADAVQIDLRLTADGHVVLMHEEGLHLWGASRPVNACTLADLAVLGDGGYYRVPTLMEVLAEFSKPDAAILVLDVGSIEVALPADDLIHRHGLDRAVIYTGSLDAMRALRARRPEATLCLDWQYDGLPPRELWEAVQPQFYNSYWQRLSRELVAELHQYGYGVLAWTVNEAAEMSRLIDMGVDGIITDYPAELVPLVRRARH